jgi:SAM-dependent methyltransferase
MSIGERVAFHEMMARLGVGDLHPGGLEASRFLLAELSRHGARRVLEVGAGIGNTTARLLAAGFDVTAIEPNPIAGAILRRRLLHVDARATSFETFDAPDGSYDAVIGESVFYAFDPATTFARARRLLRSDGLFGFAETFWTEAATADGAAFIHDQTKRMFGIPIAPRARLTAAAWSVGLRDAGFVEVAGIPLERTAADGERGLRRRRLALGLLRNPALIPTFLRYRAYQRLPWAPSGWLESRAAAWRRP